MGYRHTKDDILEAAVAAAFEDGLSQLTFGLVAKRRGISDRIVVYYFPTKDDLVTEVLFALASQLAATLAPAVSGPANDHRMLLRAAWPLLARAEADPVFALFFEAIGLAAAGREPYRTFVPQLLEGWITWATERLLGTPGRRRSEAVAAIATIDGLLMIRQLAGPEVAELAAKRIGLAGREPK